ncbi:MAG: hypothetical protein VBE63_24325, partial [Lamprobacter sp.]|uniref:hypothetical protein n=1 Tax=Lamprobacter sp. TaxID=3100796 RepID=UPI002B2629C2
MNTYTIGKGTICDIEIAANYFLVGFQEPDGNIKQFEYNDRDQVDHYVNNQLLVGFNWNGYDGYMLHAFLQGESLEALNRLSNQLVNGRRAPYQQPKVEGIDLMPLCSPKTGLKQMGVRLGYPHLEELPYTPGAELSSDEITTTRAYNIHDLNITALLYKEMSQPLALRQLLSNKYGVDLRSASDAQIGDRVMVSEYQKATGIGKKELIRMAQQNNRGTVQFQQPSWAEHISCETITAKLAERWSEMVTLLERKEQNGETTFSLPGKSNSPYRDPITIGDRSYTTGTGGLHSTDGPGSWYADDQRAILHIDVTSYYPATILNQALAPQHMDAEVFLEIFGNLVDRRLAAKREGDTQTANALKIVINSVYGKLGSWYSPWLDLQQQLQVVLTGQLALLWLIERLAQTGCANVLSANTDGLVVAVSDDECFRQVTDDWESKTGYQLDHTELRCFAQKDVNNYILVTQEGKVKSGGEFSQGHSLRKNPDNAIIAQAISQRLTKGVPIADTINTCDDITAFLKVGRTPKGILEWRGQRLGKLTRFYKSTSGDAIRVLKKDGPSSQLPGSENCRPLPVLDGIPDDLDRDWYIQTANERYRTLTRLKHFGQNRRAAELQAKGLAPVPLWGGNKTPKGASRKSRYSPSTTDFTAYDSFGTSTGQDVGIIALDLDHPDRLPNELRALIEPTLVCQAVAHREAYNFDAALRGEKKGKLFYRFNGQLPKRSKKQSLENDGYEVFYQENVALLGRRHSDGKTYSLSDHPIALLPHDLEHYLRAHAYTPTQLRQRTPSEDTPETPTPATNVNRLSRLVAQHEELSAMRYDPNAWQGLGGYVGHCPAEHQEANDRDLLITESNDRLIVKCLHETC